MIQKLWLILVTVLALAGCSTPQAEVSPTPTPTPTTAPSPTKRPTHTPTPSPTPTPTPTPSPTPTPTPTGEADPLPEGVVTALLLGTDSREKGSFGGLSDVIIVAQISEDRGHLNLVSIARDTYVPIPGYGQGKINSAFQRGGIPLMKETVSNLLGGLPIDLVVQTNFEGFIALTRWMDGFWVDNVKSTSVTVQSTGRKVVFPEGRIQLTGTDGLIYVRERKTMPLGDLDRTERGRAALIGMMERISEIAKDDPVKLAELLPMFHRQVKIVGNLELEDFPGLVELGRNLTKDDVTSVMVPITGFGTRKGSSVNILDSKRTAELAAGMREGDLSAYVAKYGTSHAPTGG